LARAGTRRREGATRYFEDFSTGETIELGSATFSEPEIIAFARQFDPQPFHTDPERAARSAFGGLVASGVHTLGAYTRLFVEQVLNHTPSMGSPGLEQIRWLKPVRAGDVLRARLVVLECRASSSRPDRGILRTRGELLDRDGEPVMTVESVNFVGRRPDGGR